jgi:GAF domain-containing protein
MMSRGHRSPEQLPPGVPAEKADSRWIEGSLGHVKDLSDRVTELSTLMGVSALVSSQRPLPEVLEQVCRLSAEICKADVAFVHLSDGDDDLVCLARHAPNDTLLYAWEGIARIYGRRASLNGKMASRSNLLLRTDGDEKHDTPSMGGICSVPLKGKSRVVGALAVGFSGVHRFSAREKDMLNAISAQLAMAVERSWLFDQLQEQLARANSLREVATRIGSNLELDQVLDSIVNHASKLLAAEFSAIFLADPPSSKTSHAEGRGSGRDQAPDGAVQMDDGPLGKAVRRAVETGSLAIVQSAQPRSQSNPSADPKPDDYRAALAVPLLSGQEVLGALVICYLERRRFDTSDISLAEDFAGQAALAIHNARLYGDAMENRLSLEAAINQINNHGISLLDDELNIRFANPATFWLIGVKPRKGAVPAAEWTALVKKGLREGAQLDQMIERIREHPEETVAVQLLARSTAEAPKIMKLMSLPLRRADGTISGRVNLLEEE